MRNMEYSKDLLDENVIRVLPNRFVPVKRVPAGYLEYLANIRFNLDKAKIKQCYYRLKNRIKVKNISWNKPWEFDPYLKEKLGK